MRFLWRWIKRLLGALILVILGLLSPVLYVETMCQRDLAPSEYAAILPPEFHRAEARTLLTYPEWHIVHAYDDYAEVIANGDPHDFRFFAAIRGYWSSLCILRETASAHGGMDAETRQMVYVIGVSFTAELGLKAVYEETIGRLFAALRGPERSALDRLSASQARNYAAFLQQTPWYRWDFERDAEAISVASDGTIRDRERAFSLGIENRSKAAYARIIARAVAGIGFDEPTLRLIVRDLPESAIRQHPTVSVIGVRPEGLELETPRYRALTNLLEDWAAEGAEFVEIAGNDDILLTVISEQDDAPDAIYSSARQGYGDYRHLLLVRVSSLAQVLRELSTHDMQLEHIHDY